MKCLDLIKSQNFFLEVIHSSPELSTGIFLERPEAQIFVEKTAYRMEAYRTSYYARVSSVFSETIFNLASCLFGIDLIKNFLVDYFYQNPTPADMIESVRGFACYLDTREDIKECPFVPDFIRLCMIINDILAAKNPNESLFIKKDHEIPVASEIFIQADHIFLKSQWPIYQMYTAAKELNDILEKEEEKKNESKCDIDKEREERLTAIKNTKESILFFKSTPWSLDSILVPNEFIPIVDNLSLGMNLEKSIENAMIDEESFDTQKFSHWMSLLTKHCAFIKK